MLTIISEKEKLKHPYYKVMDLSREELKLKLTSWTRLELIDWLCWNDRNGIYKDEESLDEIGNILQKEEAMSIVMRQILENR